MSATRSTAQSFDPATIRNLRARVCRMVESQHQIATRKLVDSNAEHEVLEDLLEASKPRCPEATDFTGLHYLLATPFRYPPLRHGSRFGSRGERGIWYGATSTTTTLAEVAFYRLLFLAGTQADIDSTATEHSLFWVDVATRAGVDLTQPPYDEREAELVDPIDRSAARALGTAMREAEVEAFSFRSARDPGRGINVGVFTPRAFATRTPDGDMQTWHCTTTRREVTFQRRAVLDTVRVVFAAADFEVDGAIATPQ